MTNQPIDWLAICLTDQPIHFMELSPITAACPLKKFQILYGMPTTDPYPESKELSSHPHSISLKFVLTVSSHLCLGFPISFFPLHFSTKTVYALLFHACCVSCASHAPWIVHSCILKRNKSYKARSFCSFTSLLLFHPSSVIFPTAPCFQIPLIYGQVQGFRLMQQQCFEYFIQ
jgi:hypothetical protein